MSWASYKVSKEIRGRKVWGFGYINLRQNNLMNHQDIILHGPSHNPRIGELSAGRGAQRITAPSLRGGMRCIGTVKLARARSGSVGHGPVGRFGAPGGPDIINSVLAGMIVAPEESTARQLERFRKKAEREREREREGEKRGETQRARETEAEREREREERERQRERETQREKAFRVHIPLCPCARMPMVSERFVALTE